MLSTPLGSTSEVSLCAIPARFGHHVELKNDKCIIIAKNIGIYIISFKLQVALWDVFFHFIEDETKGHRVSS